jgi:hypothetical protein
MKQTSSAALVIGYAAVLTILVWGSSAFAQSGASYGRGVDAYFSGSSAEADQYLSQAIQEMPNDPRPHYFRALALLRAGRRDEAIGDMQVGASVEAQRPKQFAVGTALERVQGSDQLLLEQYRRQAREALPSQGGPISRQRIELTIPSDAAVLRRPPAGPSRTESSRPNSETVGPGNPFTDDTPKPSQPVPTQSDPFAAGEPGKAAPNPKEDAATGGKLPPGKLMGVLGHVLERTVPLPSVESLRNKLPSSTSTPAKNPPAAVPSGNTPSNAANNNEDPFGGP